MVQKIKMAQQAIKAGKTAGTFIRENTTKNSSVEEYQSWSSAYQLSIPKHTMPEVAKWLTTEMT